MACSVAVGSPSPFSPKLLIPTAPRDASAATFQISSSSPSSSTTSASSSSSPFRTARLQRRPSGLWASVSPLYSIITPAAPSTSSSSSSPATRCADDTPCCSTATASAGGRDQPSPLKRKRPARLDMSAVDPAVHAACWAAAAAEPGRVSEVQADGASFSVYSKRGRARARLEDRYVAAADPQDGAEGKDVKQQHSLFGVFDGHGGHAAAEFVSSNIKRHLFSQLPASTTTTSNDIAEAVKAGYLNTDAALLASVPSGGACAVTALITPDNRLVVSHAGDCRAVLCRAGAAEALTADHRPGRPDERLRIEGLGGYVDCHRGVWRVQGSLAVSRGFGDRHLKDWVPAEPETTVLDIEPDCQFLIMASDGLWDKVSDQEAVALAADGRMASAAEACKGLADLAVSRGSMDDVTVMLVKLAGYTPRC